MEAGVTDFLPMLCAIDPKARPQLALVQGLHYARCWMFGESTTGMLRSSCHASGQWPLASSNQSVSLLYD